MSHCYYHAVSSVKRWGGCVDDYQPLHDWFDQSKAIIADPRHRALRHHAEGIFMLEDLGHIPSFADWARVIRPEPWMLRGNPKGSPGLDPTVTRASEKDMAHAH